MWNLTEIVINMLTKWHKKRKTTDLIRNLRTTQNGEAWLLVNIALNNDEDDY